MIVKIKCKEHKSFAEIDESSWSSGENTIIDGNNISLKINDKDKTERFILCSICNKVLYKNKQVNIIEYSNSNKNLLIG